jgi:hypothetical protein
MPTLTPTEVLADTLDAFKIAAPMLGSMSTEFTAEPVKLNQQVIAHIRTLPTVSDYDSSTGYSNGLTEGRDLMTDVPVTVDRHKHAGVNLGYLNGIKDKKDVYEKAIADCGYVLAKAVVDSALQKFNLANISYSSTEATNDTDRDTLGGIRKAMNSRGAAAGRVGLLNSDAFEKLDADARIASRDYYGQQTGGTPLGHLVNVAGFRDIWEYPDLGVINTASLEFTATAATDLITTASAHGYTTGTVVRVSTSAADLPAGLSAATNYYVIRVSDTTFKVGSSLANALAGTAVDITDAGTGTHTVAGYENLAGAFFEPRAIIIRTGLPDHPFEVAQALGIPSIAGVDVVTDPDTGLSLMGIRWMQPGTFDLKLTMTLMWGTAVGRQAGAAGAICDKAGHRLVTTAVS